MVLAALLVAMYALLAGAAQWGSATWAPKLGLDLEGGTQIVLEPVLTNGKRVTSQQLAQAVDIIRARVDGSGVGEAEITTQGNQNIVVALPGTPTQRQRDLIKQSAQLRFRPVIVAQPVQAQPMPTSTGTAPAPGSTPSASPTGAATSKPAATVKPGTATPTASTARRALPQALLAATTTPTTPPAGGATATPQAPPPATPSTKPTSASDPAWITPQIEQQFTALTCKDTSALQGGTDDPAKPFVTCSSDGTEKYVLGPVEVSGQNVKDATAGLAQGQNGAVTNEWEVQLAFDSKGTDQFAAVTSRLVKLQDPQNRFAIVLDGLAISAPRTNDAITGGNASITGNFTQQSATTLANQLKYGALPLTFKTQTEEQISPLLGKEQLQRGLLAGAIGLLLVIIYSLIQYRALGLVTVASLVIAGTMTYGAITLLSWSQGFRLTLAGVTGLIVSIGVTADSFIVFFERIRDEVRDGRTLRVAVETGWRRARRTIFVADGVSFLAAVVLYVLAAGSVRGFAYTLGLTTLIDVLVVIVFTHPIVALLAGTKFFGEGHRFSGLDPERLGRTLRPGTAAGGPRTTIAQRKAAAAAAGPQDGTTTTEGTL